jgi:hypothetical protein
MSRDRQESNAATPEVLAQGPFMGDSHIVSNQSMRLSCLSRHSYNSIIFYSGVTYT